MSSQLFFSQIDVKCNEKVKVMESRSVQKQDERSKNLESWLKSYDEHHILYMQPMIGDASHRRYFRIHTTTGSYVAMDAPPHQENCHAFLNISKALKTLGLVTPDIIKADLTQGFLLLTDFGDLTYLKALKHDNADQLYETALHSLSILQSCQNIPNQPIPFFDQTWMWQEWAWHKEWFLGKLLGLSLSSHEKNLDEAFSFLVKSAIAQPQVFIHRDYHSANLMVLSNNRVGILDFQDAFIGPITYDLVSLLRDCYIHWPDTRIHQWVHHYYNSLLSKHILPSSISFETFLYWFDLMGMIRHLKALFTFARKHIRDHQSHYLHHIPRTLNYVITMSERYDPLAYLHQFMQKTVKPSYDEVLSTCAQ